MHPSSQKKAENNTRVSAASTMGQSWIEDHMRMLMEQFDDRQKRAVAMSTDISQEFEQSIYMVPKTLKDVNPDAYMPKLVSFGPYHHGRPHLLPMEQYKNRACARFLQRLAESSSASASAPEKVASGMRSVVDRLLGAYGEAEVKEINKEEFLRLMIVDGCFALEFMLLPYSSYAVMDPVFGFKGMELIKHDIKRDMLLIENQLPFLAIYTLAAFRGFEVWKVNSIVTRFCRIHDINSKSRYLHILDLYRNYVNEHGKYNPDNFFEKPPPVTELSYAGISFRPSIATQSFRDISISGSVLQLTVLKIDNDTEPLLLNLMCFERMHPAAGNEVTAYVFLMESIINTSEDVKLLRKKGIIKGWLGYNDKVVNMFKQIIKEQRLAHTKNYFLVYANYFNEYDVNGKLKEHCEKVVIKFRANFMRAFWKNPISFGTVWLGVVVMLALTIIQTIFAVLSYKQAQNGP